MNLAYFDLASGASGDMLMAALVDAARRLGIDAAAAASNSVESLGLGATVSFVDDQRGGLACLRAEVKAAETILAPDRLRASLENADVPEEVRRRALAAFDTLVVAEASVHGTTPDEVHLHELGTADTPADLIGVAAALHALDVNEVAAAAVPVPRGWIEAAHGSLPLPAPVTLHLLTGAVIEGVDAESELVTPTGAAILAGCQATYGRVPGMQLHVVGVGGGTRETERPNITRVLVGSRAQPAGPRMETCVLLETNIDDQTPQSLGQAVEDIISSGALDAWVTTIQMKKTRPAFLLSVLVAPGDEARVTEMIFRRTTTLGIRRRETTRWTLERTQMTVRVDGHDVRVKVARIGDEIVQVTPEFRDCLAVAKRTGSSAEAVSARARVIATGS